MRAATLTHVCLTTWGLATTASGEFGWTRGSESSIFSDLKGPFFKKKHDEKHRETLKKTEHSNEPNVSSRKSQARRRVEMQMKFNKAATPLTNCVGVKVLLTWKQNGRSFMNQKERCKNGWLPQLHREDVGNLSIPLGWLLCFIFFLRGSNILKREGHLPLCSTFILENDLVLPWYSQKWSTCIFPYFLWMFIAFCQVEIARQADQKFIRERAEKCLVHHVD